MKKILLVDDDKVSGTLLEKQLVKDKFEVDFVFLGTDCLNKLNEKKFDLVLLDIMLPDMSGIDVLEKVREKYDSSQLPVIMVTSKDKVDDIVNALSKGANDYLIKPINFEVARARISTQIKVKELIEQSLKNKQIATVNTMVATLNHEINNPLAIAVGNLSFPYDKLDQTKIDKALSALERVADITKQIEQISQSGFEEENYSKDTQIFKLYK